MKKLLILLLIISAKGAFAQKDTIGLNVPFIDSTVAYERVFDAPNAPKNLLYSNAGLWFAETHPYGGITQLQLQDPVLSRVAGRVTASSRESYKVLWQTNYYSLTYNFTVQVDCKNGKYRVRIYNIQDVEAGYQTPVDDLMQSLIKSKSYSITNTYTLSKSELKRRFKTLNTVVDGVMADIANSILVDNSF